MELFERIAKIAREIAGSQARLAEKLNINPRTFQGYVQANRQDNLWPILQDILNAYPQIGREWLYFGEGEMLGGAVKDSATPPTPVSERETTVLRELAEAKAEIARLQKKMEMLLTRTVELQDELLAVHRAEKAKREKKAEQPSAEESVECTAHTGHTAAPLSHQGTK